MSKSDPLVLGVSGSPRRDGNNVRAVRAVLEATGCRSDFVHLIEYRVEPCRACLACVRTGRCVINDDAPALAGRVREADALVVGGFTPYSSLDARSKAFLERLYPLRHEQAANRGKPGAAVVTHAIPDGDESLPPAADMAVNAIMFFMMEEEMEFCGSVKVLGNVPCVACGKGDSCPTSGLGMIFGEGATIESVGIQSFEDQPAAVDAARSVGRAIGDALRA
jgi:multimeric flavodoxin WrbA